MLTGEVSEELAKRLFDLCVMYGRAERSVVKETEKAAEVKEEVTE